VIEFDGVGKTYRPVLGRAVCAVEDFSLHIRAGEVFGIAGPNGAGKSTLIALLLGYLRPTTGEIRIAGLRPRDYIERYGIGYLSELIGIPPRWTVRIALARYAVLAGVPDAEVGGRVEEVVDRLGLEEHRDKRVKELSKGTLQRLGLAQALLRSEAVFVLDEPTHGLDPLWTVRFRELVATIRRPDRAIVIASHNLEELERLADRVAIVDRGRLQRVVEVSRVMPMTSAAVYRLTVAAGAAHVAALFEGAVDLGRGEYGVVAADLAELNRKVAALIERGTLLAGIAPAQSALEQEFREAIGEAV
jgi:ABC-type multidrug transport system ATPase subunit